MASQAMNGSMPVHDAGQYSFFDSMGDDGGLEGGLDGGLQGGLEVNTRYSLHGMAAMRFMHMLSYSRCLIA